MNSQNEVYKKHRLVVISLITFLYFVVFVLMLIDGYIHLADDSFTNVFVNVVSSSGVSLIYSYSICIFMAFLFNFFYKKPVDNKGV